MEECEHTNLQIIDEDPATREAWYKCLDCGAIINQDGEVVQEPSDEILF